MLLDCSVGLNWFGLERIAFALMLDHFKWFGLDCTGIEIQLGWTKFTFGKEMDWIY